MKSKKGPRGWKMKKNVMNNNNNIKNILNVSICSIPRDFKMVKHKSQPSFTGYYSN